MKTHAQKLVPEIAAPRFERHARHAAPREVLSLLALVVIVAAAIGLSSCAGYTTSAASTTTQSGTGVLSVSPTTIDFGNVDVGSSATQALTLTDTGTAPVNISGVSLSGSGFTLVGGSYSGTVAVGQSVALQLQFAPQSAGSISGSLTVTSDASSSTAQSAGTSSPITSQAKFSFKVTLHGNATQSSVSISPSSLDFSNVTVGQTSTQGVTLTNTGTSNLQLKGASASGTGFAISGLSTPQMIPPGQAVSFSVQFTPASTGTVNGSVSFIDNAPGTPQSLPLTGNAVAANGTLSANPGSVNFGNVVVGSSGQQTITLTNSGAGAMTINQVNTTGATFSTSGISAGQTIAAGAQASFTAKFSPTATGTVSGTIAISTSASNPTLSVALTGTGTQGQLSANPTSIKFGSVLVGSKGSASVTLSNTGTAPVSVSAASVSGTGFTISGFTAGTLSPGATSSLTVTFSPASAVSYSGSLSVTSNAPGSPLTINLSGSGTAAQPQLTISPSSVAFSGVNVGSSSSKTVTLSNTGNATLNITAATISGSGYAMTLAPTTINAGTNTTFSVTFAPTLEGSAAGSISITSNAPGSPATIALSGTGLQALGSVSPTSVSFGSVAVGSSNSSAITLTNKGSSTLTFPQVSVTGSGFGVSGISTSSTVAAGGTLNFNAVFAPASANSSSGSITLTTNGSPAQLTISLTGTGTAATQTLSASPTSLSFGNVQVGNSNSLTTTITNSGNSDVTISSVSVTGSGYTTSGITSGLILSPNQTATLTIKFSPAGLGSTSGSVSIVSNATNSPTTISLSGESHTVLLSWTASTSTGVTGYYVYRKTSSGPYAKINPSSPATSTQFTDTTVQAGTTYSYEVTAVDSSGVESSYSSATSVSVP